MTRQLVVRRGSQVVLTCSVTCRPCTIGRAPDSDLVLPDATVSPYHAEIRSDGDATVLTDLDSETGTFLGGVRVQPQQPRTIEHGETVTIGPYQLAYRSNGAEPRASKPAMAEPATAVAPVEAVPESEPDTAETPHRPEVPIQWASGRYLQHLPMIFHENDFLSRFLEMFETVWEPLEQRRDHIDMYFSARTCPAAWLPWLASWFGLTLEAHWSEARKRALLARGLDLYRWRGTAYGLERVIEACVGSRPDITVTPSEPFVFHVKVRVPVDAGEYIAHDLNELIGAHKPAHTGYVLEILR